MKRSPIVLLGAILVLGGIACGGGGGAVTVTLSRDALTVVGIEGGRRPWGYLHATVRGGGSHYAAAIADRPGLFEFDVIPVGQDTAQLTFAVPNPGPPGRLLGAIVLALCNDEACESVAWSKTIPYTITVYGLAEQPVLTGYEGDAPVVKKIEVVPSQAARDLDVKVTDPSATPWLAMSRDGDGDITLTAATAGKAKGSYGARLTLSVNLPDVIVDPHDVPVALTVGDGIVAPPDVELTLGAGGAPTTGTLPVSFQGAQRPAWSATSSAPWLALTPASGTGPGSVGYGVDLSALDDMPNWTTAEATIELSAAGLSSVQSHVRLRRELPEVYAVSPGAVFAGEPATVQVRGRGFAQLGSGGAISVAGADGAIATILSDTEATLQLPGLAPGSHVVSIANAYGLPSLQAAVAAAPRGALEAAVVPSAGSKGSVVFDPARGAVFMVSRERDDKLYRFRSAAGGWQVDSVAIPGIGNLGLSPDGRTLYAVARGDLVHAISADTLQIEETYARPRSSIDDVLDVGGFYSLSFTANGRVWLPGDGWTGAFYFDVVSRTFGVKLFPQGTTVSYARESVSADGSRFWVTDIFGGGLVYTTADDAIRRDSLMPNPYGGVEPDRTGARALLGEETLYETGTWNLLGQAIVAPDLGSNAVVSPDGTRVYRIVLAESPDPNDVRVDRIDVFDADSLVPATSRLVKLGEIPVAGQAGHCTAQSSYGCSPFPWLTISPLGDTLFLYGNAALVVVPIPENLAGAAPAAALRLDPPALRRAQLR